MPPLSLFDRLTSLPDECLELILSYLQPSIWQANPRLACKRLEAIIDCNLLRRMPLGLLWQAPKASGSTKDGKIHALPDLTTLAGRFPHAHTLRRHAAPNECLAMLLQQLSALPDASWPAVTCLTDASTGEFCEGVQVLQQVARVCPNLEELQLTLPDFKNGRRTHPGISSRTTTGMHVWDTSGQVYTAVAAALRCMPRLQRLQLTVEREKGYSSEDDAGLSILCAALPGLTALTQLHFEDTRGAPGLQLASLSGLRELKLHSTWGQCMGRLAAVNGTLANITSLDLAMGDDSHVEPKSILDDTLVGTLARVCPMLNELRLQDAVWRGAMKPDCPTLDHLTRLELIITRGDPGLDPTAEGQPVNRPGVGLEHVAPMLQVLSVDGTCGGNHLVTAGHPTLEELHVKSLDDRKHYGRYRQRENCDCTPSWLRAAGILSVSTLVCCLNDSSFPAMLTCVGFQAGLHDCDHVPFDDPKRTFYGRFKGWAMTWTQLRSLDIDAGSLGGRLPLCDILSVLADTPPATTLVRLTIKASSHVGGTATRGDPSAALARLSSFQRLALLSKSFVDGKVPGFFLMGVQKVNDALLRDVLGPPRLVRERGPALREIVVVLAREQVVRVHGQYHLALHRPVTWACCDALCAAHPGLRFEVE